MAALRVHSLLTIDVCGAVADTTAGTVERSGWSEPEHGLMDYLDAAGSTTAAADEGFKSAHDESPHGWAVAGRSVESAWRASRHLAAGMPHALPWRAG